MAKNDTFDTFDCANMEQEKAKLVTNHPYDFDNGVMTSNQAEQKLSPWDLLKLDPLIDHTPLVATLDD